MRLNLCATRAVVVAVVALAVAPADAPANRRLGSCASRLCAGAARADVTPPVTTPMWGYGSRAAYAQPDRWITQHTRAIDTDAYQKGGFLRSEGIDTRLYARALLIRNRAGAEVALVQVDIGAVTGEIWRAVLNRVEPLGVSGPHLLISATHTHGGPGAAQQAPAHGLLVGDAYDPRVFKRIVDGIAAAITVAHGRMAPARVAIGQGVLIGASANRSLTPHLSNPCPDPAAVDDGTTCDHGKPGEDALSPDAIDPHVTMVRADRVDGVPLGVWTSFAAHGTVFGGDNLLFTGDNQGVAERLVERGIAERAAARGIHLPAGWQIVDAYANGTEGDIAPYCTGYNDFACVEETGLRQARAVLSLYDSLGPSLVDDIPLDGRLDVLYMKGDGGTSPLAVLGAGPDCPAGRPPLDQPPTNEIVPGQGRKCPLLPLTGLGPSWFWLQTMRLGDYLLANVPGEMTVQMGRRLRKRLLDSPANRDAAGNPIVHHALVVGLANDYMAYLTTPEEYNFQWYEGQFTLWGPQEGPLMQARMGALSDRMLSGQPSPAYTYPPDTSGMQAENASPLTQALSVAAPTRAPGTVLTQAPQAAKRGTVVTFAWAGGQPSAEITPGEAFVTTQHRTATGWRTIFTDESFEDLTDYARDGIDDHWDTRWDVPLDAATGGYRFVVTGKVYVSGAIRRYSVTSSAFQVVPADGLTATSATLGNGGVLIHAAYPAPDPAVNFRLRPASPADGTVTLTVTHADGSTATGSGAYDAPAGAYAVPVPAALGDVVNIAPGALKDRYGNVNGAAFTGAVK